MPEVKVGKINILILGSRSKEKALEDFFLSIIVLRKRPIYNFLLVFVEDHGPAQIAEFISACQLVVVQVGLKILERLLDNREQEYALINRPRKTLLLNKIEECEIEQTSLYQHGYLIIGGPLYKNDNAFYNANMHFKQLIAEANLTPAMNVPARPKSVFVVYDTADFILVEESFKYLRSLGLVVVDGYTGDDRSGFWVKNRSEVEELYRQSATTLLLVSGEYIQSIHDGMSNLSTLAEMLDMKKIYADALVVFLDDCPYQGVINTGNILFTTPATQQADIPFFWEDVALKTKAEVDR